MLVSMVTDAASSNKVKRVKPRKPIKPVQLLTCKSRKSKCFMKRVKCPIECPSVKPKNPKEKACFLDCYSPKCEAVEPTTIHGSKDWDDNVDHLKLFHDGMELVIPEGHSFEWSPTEGDVQVERTSTTNSMTITIPDLAEISVNVIPVSEEDSIIHNYQIPSNDCFAHLEVQFRFLGCHLMLKVFLEERIVLILKIQQNQEWQCKWLAVMTNCAQCMFSPDNIKDEHGSRMMEYGILDCKGGENGITCKK
ncbi:hypothetical protein R6Q57_015755 [Mikania cordata]